MNFFAKYKQLFLIIGFILLIGIIGFFIYLSFFRQAFAPAPGEKPEQPAATSTGQLPGSNTGTGQIIPEEGTEGSLPEEIKKIPPAEKAAGGKSFTKTTLLSKDPAGNPVLGKDGKSLQYYDKADGKFYRLDENGKAVPLSEKVFYNASNVVWSPKKSEAIIEYPDGSNIVYNFETEHQVTLPKQWEAFDFSSDGSQIVMKSIGQSVENRYLAISKNDGSSQQALEFIGENADKVIPSWSPNNQIAAMYTEGKDLNRQEVFFVGLNKENFKSTIIEGRGFQPKWSEKGDKLVYSVYSTDNNLKPKLWVVNAEGDAIGSNRQNLEIETWASKCSFANNTDLYCGVPEFLEDGSGLFPEMAKNTKDNLYKINIETGQRTLVAMPDGSYNMSNISISADGKNLYFTDANSAQLHKIILK